MVRSGPAIVGTVRSNSLATPAAWNRCAEQFPLERFRACRADEMAVCSRLAVAPEHRDACVRDLLFHGIYERRLLKGTRLCLAAGPSWPGVGHWLVDG